MEKMKKIKLKKIKLKKHSFKVRRRAFRMWQNLGHNPWRKSRKSRRKGDGHLYKGAFNSIPFLNDDAKRTFTHLLMRPGYMIRDYIRGKHEIYLAPFTALIVFYAFFSLMAAVLQPIQQKPNAEMVDMELLEQFANNKVKLVAIKTAKIVQKGYYLINLDRFPEQVDTRREVALAAFEGKLRSQGIPLFLGKFFLLWLSMAVALRKYKVKMSAAAAASAYVLCQFSFFMLFALMLTLGEKTSIGLLLMAILLATDYHQWLGVRWKKSVGLVIKTGLFYVLFFLAVVLLVSAITALIAWITV